MFQAERLECVANDVKISVMKMTNVLNDLTKNLTKLAQQTEMAFALRQRSVVSLKHFFNPLHVAEYVCLRYFLEGISLNRPGFFGALCTYTVSRKAIPVML